MTNTARLIAAGITRVPFSLKNAEAYCAGKQLGVRRSLLPVCITCPFRDPGGRMNPPAKQRAGGVWGCSMADTAVPGASVGADSAAVGTGEHRADCAPTHQEATSRVLGGCGSIQHTEG